MMLGHLRDISLPGLETLDQTCLARIAGTPQARLLRVRYRPGARAILHVALGAQRGAGEGAIWFYAGDKAQRLAGRLRDARLDPPTGALFQTFPNDHRMPMLATFVDGAPDLAERLIGGPAMGPPELMRYRPGLSATFRWTRPDGRRFFVKQAPREDIHVQAQTVSRISDAVGGQVLSVAAVAGLMPQCGLIAYDAAPGQFLDTLLLGADAQSTQLALAQVTGALRVLWSSSVVPNRVLDRPALLRTAAQASMMIGLFDPRTGRCAAKLAHDLETRPVRVRLGPIHADMKLEHAFLSGPLTTLIDLESLSLGDPDYDLAKLEARVTMAEVTGHLTSVQSDAARAAIRRDAGRDYGWFLTCARLQCARFYAQRFDPAAVPLLRRVLAPS